MELFSTPEVFLHRNYSIDLIHRANALFKTGDMQLASDEVFEIIGISIWDGLNTERESEVRDFRAELLSIISKLPSKTPGRNCAKLGVLDISVFADAANGGFFVRRELKQALRLLGCISIEYGCRSVSSEAA